VPADLAAAVAAELRLLVQQRKLSGRKLAELSGLPTSNVAAKLRGVRPVDMSDLARLAGALGVTAAYVVARAEAARDHSVE
jgi:transcriptional regulator with XRE-family HTH domain